MGRMASVLKPAQARPQRRGRAAWDARHNTYCVRILPGEAYTTGAGDEMIVTILGSCVAACVRNPWTGFCGMNHFMLPESETGEWNGATAAMRYGNYAMEALINEVLKSGCARRELEIKLFGGSNLANGASRVGDKNIDFVLKYLAAEGLRVTASDLGGPVGRRIHFFTKDGSVKRLLMKPTNAGTLLADELKYRIAINETSVGGDVELFD
ncbi:Chemoreceptor glutamine deamidase CheD [Hartmannibacter diazotrophicus]|uniref:Probable chemoreceptor glutamine deamidase CheD n=1 Tax=Hartmannibacter diazotrophicus TaxID=1482074 RepID=A0A2C9DDL2_9HYPH|nr:chemoreceptor glutamine deamidase CheD [Hartmannibacter diazotrophicus]SON58260.1 Chemoreceptor glutamine deamidase CheD [Hartmannibacter diazotrophicus]